MWKEELMIHPNTPTAPLVAPSHIDIHLLHHHYIIVR